MNYWDTGTLKHLNRVLILVAIDIIELRQKRAIDQKAMLFQYEQFSIYIVSDILNFCWLKRDRECQSLYW
ncbi:hypothetical protein QQG55_25665 [Brugia pahangi]